MEHLHPTTYAGETLKATLNTYRLASADSLSGPGGIPALIAQMWYKQNKELPPIQPPPIVQIPFLLPNDKSAIRSETMLVGEKIACFIVGGEKRLCLPQILTSVLREYSIAEINQACGELHIYCSRCLPEQLEILKALGILPINTAQCGLITKTDAERLVALLTDRQVPYRRERLPKDVDPDEGIPVYHECFGRGYGKFYAKAYVSPVSACILCKDCGNVYSPQRFITHSDRSFEKRTCHWGFDPENWRNYLLLPKDLQGVKREEYQKILDQAKARFDRGRYDVNCAARQQQPTRYTASPPTPNKRRIESDQDSPSRKKIKEEDTKVYDPAYMPNPYASLPYGVPAVMRHSAFRPWSPRSAEDIPVSQDIAHLKGLVPFALDRRGFPQYVQAGRPPPALLSREAEFALPKSTTESRQSTNILSPTSHHSDRKQSVDRDSRTSGESPLRGTSYPKDKNNNASGNPSPHSGGRVVSKVGQGRSSSFEQTPVNPQQAKSVSPSRSHNIAEISPRACRMSPVRYHATSQPTKSVSGGNNSLKEPTQEVSRPVSRSREAAATAMLELKTAGQYRSRPHSPVLASVPSQSSQRMAPVSSTLKFAGSVSPLDSSRQHYKWSIEGRAYIVSASGVQTLESLRNIVESECPTESGRSRLMHELVKMKSLFEEKLDIELRVRRDLQIEFDHLKNSSREKLEAVNESKNLLKQEIESMREEHIRRLEDFNKRQDASKNGKQIRGEPSLASDPASVKELKELRFRIEELEMKNDRLRIDLLQEREKRENAETKFGTVENARGRMNFLTESQLSRMMRGVVRKANDDDKAIVSPTDYTISQKSKKYSSTPASAASSTPHGRLGGVLPQSAIGSTAMNGISDPSIRSEVETQKAVIVS